jgi:hypothetical protein
MISAVKAAATLQGESKICTATTIAVTIRANIAVLFYLKIAVRQLIAVARTCPCLHYKTLTSFGYKLACNDLVYMVSTGVWWTTIRTRRNANILLFILGIPQLNLWYPAEQTYSQFRKFGCLQMTTSAYISAVTYAATEPIDLYSTPLSISVVALSIACTLYSSFTRRSILTQSNLGWIPVQIQIEPAHLILRTISARVPTQLTSYLSSLSCALFTQLFVFIKISASFYVLIRVISSMLYLQHIPSPLNFPRLSMRHRAPANKLTNADGSLYTGNCGVQCDSRLNFTSRIDDDYQLGTFQYCSITFWAALYRNGVIMQ